MILRNCISILFFFLILSFKTNGQSEKLHYSFEYSPNFSKLTDGLIFSTRAKLSHNVNFRLLYEFSKSTKFTIGLGYLNTGDGNRSIIGGTLGIESIEFIDSYHYVHIPIGLKYDVGGFYILPEIALAFNVANTTTVHTVYINGDRETEFRDIVLNSGSFNPITVPIILAIGFDFELGGNSFCLGAKVYHSLNTVFWDVPRKAHYQGAGLLFGANF